MSTQVVVDVGPVSCLLQLSSTTAIIGTADGRCVFYHKTSAGSEWHAAAAETIHDGVSVDSIHVLLPGLLMVNCAGELRVHCIPDLRTVDDGSIATRCTGAVCLQEKGSKDVGGVPRRAGPVGVVAEARVCAATHGHLLILNVDDGAADAQVSPTRLRCKRFAKIGIS